MPADWPGGDRHGGDVSLACCFRMELGKVHPDTAACSRRDREPLKQQKLREVEYRCVGALADQSVVPDLEACEVGGATDYART